MSISLNTNFRLPPIRSDSKPYSGSKIRCQSFAAMDAENSKSQLFTGVHKSLQLRSHNPPTRARVKMMSMSSRGVPPMVTCEDEETGEVYSMDACNVLYRQRIIFLQGFISESYATYLMAVILYLDSVFDKMIRFVVSCPGGDLTPSLQLYDTMRCMRNKTATTCIGQAHDLMGLFMTGGDKGFRSAFPSSNILIKPPIGRARGQVDEMINESRELTRVSNYMLSELSKNTGHPLEKVTEDFRKPRNFFADAAVDYGLIDKVIRSGDLGPKKRVVLMTRKKSRKTKETGTGTGTTETGTSQ